MSDTNGIIDFKDLSAELQIKDDAGKVHVIPVDQFFNEVEAIDDGEAQDRVEALCGIIERMTGGAMNLGQSKQVRAMRAMYILNRASTAVAEWQKKTGLQSSPPTTTPAQPTLRPVRQEGSPAPVSPPAQ